MSPIKSGIHDNYYRGSMGEFLKSKIKKDADLSFVSAYFTIYAFEALKDKLLEIDRLRFLFGEPRFIRSLDPEKTDKKFFKIIDDHLEIGKRLQQKQLAKQCANWIQAKAEIRSVKTSLIPGSACARTQ